MGGGRRWSDEEIKTVRENRALTAKEVSDLLPGRSVSAVNQCRRKFNIRADYLAVRNGLDSSLALEDLSSIAQQIIISGLHCDGSIKRTSVTGHVYYRFAVNHGAKQYDYGAFKARQLDELGATTRTSPYKYGGTRIWVSTASLPMFKTIYDEIYDRKNSWGHRTKGWPGVHWTERLDDLGLVLCVADDGCLPKRSGMRIGWHRPNGEQIADTARILRRKFDVDIRAYNHKDSRALYFTTEATETILPRLRAAFLRFQLPECVAYKFWPGGDYPG